MSSNILLTYLRSIILGCFLLTETSCQELFLYAGGSPVAKSVYSDLFQEYTRRHEKDILVKGEFLVADIHECLGKLLHQEQSLLSFIVTRKGRFCTIADYSTSFIAFPVFYTLDATPRIYHRDRLQQPKQPSQL
nr:unnamed protein product [Spirometra erinaceieuropaei]